jgi:hypothetical protein
VINISVEIRTSGRMELPEIGEHLLDCVRKYQCSNADKLEIWRCLHGFLCQLFLDKTLKGRLRAEQVVTKVR